MKMHDIRLIHIFYGLNLGVPLQHRNLTFCYFKIVLSMAGDKDIFFVWRWWFSGLSFSFHSAVIDYVTVDIKYHPRSSIF